MRLTSTFSFVTAALAALVPFTSAERILESNSLATCMDNSSFSATLFNVAFTPDNGSLAFSLNGVSQISGNVMLEFQVLGYGYNVYHNTINPCDDSTLKGLCPMNQGQIPNLQSNAQLPADTVNKVPSTTESFL
jgi:ML-like domain